jgi:hypothetical protein
MVPYHSYELFQAGRPLSVAQQREADARTGELAAAISRPIVAARARIRAGLRVPSAEIKPGLGTLRRRHLPAPAGRAPWHAAECECLAPAQRERSYAGR